MKRIIGVLALAMAITAATGCAKPVDVAKAVQVTVVTSGWVTVDTTGDKNKIVPSVTLTLKNASAATLNALQVNAVFRRVSTNDEIASEFRPVSNARGLAAGAASDRIVLRAPLGYTGTDPVDDLLKNSHFVDAKVEVFVKAGPGSWTKVGEYPIAREFTGD
jgi:hypothetical protein